MNQMVNNGSAARTIKPTVFKTPSNVLATQISTINFQALATPK
jgi:hypothetical protein